MAVNRYGLTRDIPAEIKREVRKRCSFCCVFCTSAIIQYDHFSPEYKECRTHDPEGITLLCGSHHDLVTRNIIGRDEVIQADAERRTQSPDAFVHYLKIRKPYFTVLGSALFTNTGLLLEVEGVQIIRIETDEFGLLQLSARLYNTEGFETVVIDRNELIVCANNWDVEINGNTLLVRQKRRHIALEMTISPPHGVVVKTLDMKVRGWTFKTTTDGLLLVTNGSATLDFANSVSILNGPIVLGPDGVAITGGCAFGVNLPIDYAKLVEQGNFQPIIDAFST